MRGWPAYTLAVLLALCPSPQSLRAQDLPRLLGTVTRVIDGDTIDVQLASAPIRVRLHAVDTPERGQPWGREATAALADLVLGRQIELEPFEQDAYDRLVARVFLDDRDINGELIKQGHGWVYRKYMTREDVEYCSFELDARSAARGLWSLQDDQRLPPWQWRRLANRSTGAYWVYAHEITLKDCVAEVGAITADGHGDRTAPTDLQGNRTARMLAAPSATSGIVKKSRSGICHAPSSPYYARTQTFTPFETLEDCLASDGRLPRNRGWTDN